MAPGREPDQQLCGYGYYSNATINSTGLAYLDTISSNSNFGTILLIAQDTTAGSEFFSWTLNTYGGNAGSAPRLLPPKPQKPRQQRLVLPCRLPLRRPAPWGLSTGNENDAVGAAVSQNGCDHHSKLCSMLTGEQQGVSRDPLCYHN
jgi:hypothetical protein